MGLCVRLQGMQSEQHPLFSKSFLFSWKDDDTESCNIKLNPSKAMKCKRN